MTVEPLDENKWLDELEKEWWEKASNVTSFDEVPDLAKHLMEDYKHTYASTTIAGAIITYAMFRAWAAEADVTGFQAKYANMLIFDRIAYGGRVDVAKLSGAPLSRHIYYGDMMTPMGMDSIRTFSPRVKEWLRSEAQARLADPDKYDSATKAHLRKLAAGNYPKWMKFEDVVYRRGEDE